jgi:hypothetical protein
MHQQYIGQQSMSIAPSQPRLKDSPRSRSEIKRSFWVVDQKNLEHRRTRILDDSRMIFTHSKQNYSKQLERRNVEEGGKGRRGMD